MTARGVKAYDRLARGVNAHGQYELVAVVILPCAGAGGKHVRLYTRDLFEGIFYEIGLERKLRGIAHVLELAAAALFKYRTGRRHPVRRGRQHPPALAVGDGALYREYFYFRPLARKAMGHEYGRTFVHEYRLALGAVTFGRRNYIVVLFHIISVKPATRRNASLRDPRDCGFRHPPSGDREGLRAATKNALVGAYCRSNLLLFN